MGREPMRAGDANSSRNGVLAAAFEADGEDLPGLRIEGEAEAFWVLAVPDGDVGVRVGSLDAVAVTAAVARLSPVGTGHVGRWHPVHPSDQASRIDLSNAAVAFNPDAAARRWLYIIVYRLRSASSSRNRPPAPLST